MVNLNWKPSQFAGRRLNNFSELEGCQYFDNVNFKDNRGSFRKITSAFPGGVHLGQAISQVNISQNPIAGTIRGLHYQVEPFMESKIITCIRGEIFDVALDMRLNSGTFGKYFAINLTPESGSFLIPPMVAHGFQTLMHDTTVVYLHSNHYSPIHSQGVNPFDSTLDIAWPLQCSFISDADKSLPLISGVSH